MMLLMQQQIAMATATAAVSAAEVDITNACWHQHPPLRG